MKQYDTLIIIAAKDFPRISVHYGRLPALMSESKGLFFVGNEEVGKMLRELPDPALQGFAQHIPEDAILPFSEVHAFMEKRLTGILQGRKLPRGVTGWYYQQFLKMQYARQCEDEYYMVWDGDTLPCRPLHMFREDTGQPYLDLKTELKEAYFETMGKLLPGLHKFIAKSFISEHMLIRRDIMCELLDSIEENKELSGSNFWEKILSAIEADKLQDAVFSEFETYGCFVALRHPDTYRLREWHSFRLGGEFFDPAAIGDRDFAWLGRDFDAISFEKGHIVREDHKNLFDNPEYQEKLTPRQMLEAIQDLFKGGYVEKW